MFKVIVNPNPHFRNSGGMDTNFRRYGFWGRLGGQTFVTCTYDWLIVALNTIDQS